MCIRDRRTPRGREEGDRDSGARRHRTQRTDSLPFPRCRPWFVEVAHHTGKALAIPVSCDLAPRYQLLAFRLRDGYIQFFFQEGGGKINMKINGLKAEREWKYWKLLPVIHFSGAQEYTGDRRTESSSEAGAWSLRDRLENEIQHSRESNHPELCPHSLSLYGSGGLALKWMLSFKRIHLKISSSACIYKNNFSQLEHKHVLHICGHSIVQQATSEYHTKVNHSSNFK